MKLFVFINFIQVLNVLINVDSPHLFLEVKLLLHLKWKNQNKNSSPGMYLNSSSVSFKGIVHPFFILYYFNYPQSGT